MITMIGNSESGVTLLLAVLLVSAITLIAITISVLAIQSIRNSRAVLLSEPALASAHSGAEEGVFGIKRASAPLDCNSSNTKSSAPVGNVWSASAVCKSHGAATFNVIAGKPYVFYLYNADDPSDTVLQDSYTCMTLDMVSATRNVNLNVSVTRFDGNAIGTPSSYPTPIGLSTTGTHTTSSCNGASVQTTITGLAVNNASPDHRMIVTLNYCPLGGCAASDSATVVIDTDVGIPTVPTVDSIGCAQKTTGNTSANTCNGAEIYSRRVQVTVPQ